MNTPVVNGTYFVTNELWVSNDGGGAYWTEAGIFRGAGAGGQWFSLPTLYWADHRPGQSYAEHDDANGSYTLGTNVTADIHSLGGTSWAASVGQLSGTSVSNFSNPSRMLNAGTETTTDTTHSDGTARGLSYYTLSNSLISNWSSSGAGSAVGEAPTGSAANTMLLTWFPNYSGVQTGAGTRVSGC